MNERLDWTSAADEEMGSLREAGVFKVVPRSEANGRVVSSRWVFKIKKNSDGSNDWSPEGSAKLLG